MEFKSVLKHTFPKILVKLATFSSHPNWILREMGAPKIKRSIPAPKWFSPSCSHLSKIWAETAPSKGYFSPR